MFEETSFAGRLSSEDCFGIWAPEISRWSAWAKPVVFASVPGFSLDPPLVVPPLEARGLPDAWTGGAVVIDMPGDLAVLAGLALAGRGFRPVPLFNGTDGPNPIVHMDSLIRALGTGAPLLKAMTIAPDARPVFLLDSNRRDTMGAVQASYYDNRWVVLPQDFPSAAMLASHGIGEVTLVQRGPSQPSEDLAHVMLRWQQGGIRLRAVELTRNDVIDPLVVSEPSLFRKAWYAAIALMGLRRSNVGGFGAYVPEQQAGSGGFYG